MKMIWIYGLEQERRIKTLIKMVNGNDMIEHTQRCEECQKREEEQDTPNLTEEQKRQLSQDIYECYCNSFGEE